MQTTELSQKTIEPPRFRAPALKTFFNRQWWWTTLLVLAAIAVMARLGVWQLDRRQQRRAYNADIVAKLALPPLPLTGDPLPAEPAELKNRQATVQGTYDLDNQVALTQQHWMNRPGFHLITPLVIQGTSKAVLVNRGWLPAAQLPVENWPAYDVVGPVEVTGFIKLSQTRSKNSEDTEQTPDELLRQWFRVDVADIEAQLPYELLPIYLQLAPSPEAEGVLPYRSELETDLSEGPHLSYAIQWFIFATILGVGYVHFVSKNTKETIEEFTE